jgi:hypothetical protein
MVPRRDTLLPLYPPISPMYQAWLPYNCPTQHVEIMDEMPHPREPAVAAYPALTLARSARPNRRIRSVTMTVCDGFHDAVQRTARNTLPGAGGRLAAALS